jgi:hypothetical protein
METHEVKLRYRGRAVTTSDVAFIQDLIARHPEASRRRLSALLCEHWGWVQPNGQLRDMVCRGLMLALHRAGLIELPPVRLVAKNPLASRTRPRPVVIDSTPIEAAVSSLRPLEFRLVRRTHQEPIFNGLMEEHHYLGYVQPVGEHLKYIVYSKDRPVACLAWCSAPRHLGPRDRFIGWSQEARRRNVRFLAYNTRFLILPWVRVPCLASHILGRMAKLLAKDWEAVYGHPVYLLETFVDPARNKGTCYLAANWIRLGRTTGRGNNAPTHKPRVPIKEILALPLSRRFRKLLGGLQ